MHTLRVWFALAAMTWRSQLQYRRSFLLACLAQILITGFDFAGLAFLAQRFAGIAGWSIAEIGLFYGLISCGLGLGLVLGHPLTYVDEQIRSGSFDAVLVRPAPAVVQVCGRLELQRLGRCVQGLAVLVWAVSVLPQIWTWSTLALAAWTVMGGAAFFLGILLLQATTAFWTQESIEAFNILTYGGSTIASLPMDLYESWLRRFFTWVIPLAAVGYLPVLAILGREPPMVGWLAPLAGFAMLGLGLMAWRWGVRHYTSTGS